MYFFFYTGTVTPENLNQNIDSNDLRISSNNLKLQSDYVSDHNVPLIRKNLKKKGKIRFKCLHCDYLTFRKQNLVGHLRQKHEVSTLINNVIIIFYYSFYIFRIENS